MKPGTEKKFIKIEKPTRTFIEKIRYYLFAFFRLPSIIFWTKSNKRNFNLLKTSEKIDVIIANDLDTLPIAVKLKEKNTSLIFDAHEYYPSSGQATGFKGYLKKYSFLLVFRNYYSPSLPQKRS